MKKLLLLSLALAGCFEINLPQQKCQCETEKVWTDPPELHDYALDLMKEPTGPKPECDGGALFRRIELDGGLSWECFTFSGYQGGFTPVTYPGMEIEEIR